MSYHPSPCLPSNVKRTLTMCDNVVQRRTKLEAFTFHPDQVGQSSSKASY